jgi:hypothetical protein
MTAPDGGPLGRSFRDDLASLLGRLHDLEEWRKLHASDMSEVLAAHDALIEQLVAQVAELMAEEKEEDDETAQVDWYSLKRDAAEDEWKRLYDWLETYLVPTHRISPEKLLACWPCHPFVRDQLSWLRVCWAQAYRRPRASGSAAAEWHSRWFRSAFTLTAEHLKGCECDTAHHEGKLLLAHARKESKLSTRDLWLDDGRLADIAGRPEPEEN